MAAAATAGLPDAQRDADGLVLHKVPQIGSAARTTDKTVRKLTRIEMLLRAGILEQHEADACDWYADVAALAWDTTRCTANYDGGGGGGGSASAPNYLEAKTIEISDARDDYRYARLAIPEIYLGMFEAIACRNEAVGTVAEQLFGQLKRSQRESKIRAAFKLCANRLHEQVRSRLPVR